MTFDAPPLMAETLDRYCDTYLVADSGSNTLLPLLYDKYKEVCSGVGSEVYPKHTFTYLLKKRFSLISQRIDYCRSTLTAYGGLILRKIGHFDFKKPWSWIPQGYYLVSKTDSEVMISRNINHPRYRRTPGPIYDIVLHNDGKWDLQFCDIIVNMIKNTNYQEKYEMSAIGVRQVTDMVDKLEVCMELVTEEPSRIIRTWKNANFVIQAGGVLKIIPVSNEMTDPIKSGYKIDIQVNIGVCYNIIVHVDNADKIKLLPFIKQKGIGWSFGNLVPNSYTFCAVFKPEIDVIDVNITKTPYEKTLDRLIQEKRETRKKKSDRNSKGKNTKQNLIEKEGASKRSSHDAGNNETEETVKNKKSKGNCLLPNKTDLFSGKSKRDACVSVTEFERVEKKIAGKETVTSNFLSSSVQKEPVYEKSVNSDSAKTVKHQDLSDSFRKSMNSINQNSERESKNNKIPVFVNDMDFLACENYKTNTPHSIQLNKMNKNNKHIAVNLNSDDRTTSISQDSSFTKTPRTLTLPKFALLLDKANNSNSNSNLQEDSDFSSFIDSSGQDYVTKNLTCPDLRKTPVSQISSLSTDNSVQSSESPKEKFSTIPLEKSADKISGTTSTSTQTLGTMSTNFVERANSQTIDTISPNIEAGTHFESSKISFATVDKLETLSPITEMKAELPTELPFCTSYGSAVFSDTHTPDILSTRGETIHRGSGKLRCMTFGSVHIS